MGDALFSAWECQQIRGQLDVFDAVAEVEETTAAETTEPVEAEAASDSPTSPTVETLDTGELGVVLDDGPATVVLTAEDTIELDLVPTTMTRAEAVTLARALLAIAQE